MKKLDGRKREERGSVYFDETPILAPYDDSEVGIVFLNESWVSHNVGRIISRVVCWLVGERLIPHVFPITIIVVREPPRLLHPEKRFFLVIETGFE